MEKLTTIDMGSLISIEELMEATGYKKAGHVESWLQQNNIPYFHGKQGNIITTIDKINDALDGELKRLDSIEFGNGTKT